MALVPLLAFMFLRWFEHQQVYHPSKPHEADPAELGLQFEDVTLDHNPKLHAWFFSAKANSPRGHIAVLVCHGNGGNISHCLGLTEALLETGVNVMVFDYRGYGRSPGKPSEEGTYEDAQAAYQWLRKKSFDGANIIVYGESLGGAIATELVLREKIGALILQSTFTCIPDIGSEIFPWLPVRRICRVSYNTIGKLPQIKIPVLILHSRGDRMIRFSHAERNFAAANDPKRFLEIKGDHNEALIASRTELVGAVEELLATYAAASLQNRPKP